MKLKVPEEAIKVCAKTGFVVDLTGKAAPVGNKRLIAFRAGIFFLLENDKKIIIRYRCPIDVRVKWRFAL